MPPPRHYYEEIPVKHEGTPLVGESTSNGHHYDYNDYYYPRKKRCFSPCKCFGFLLLAGSILGGILVVVMQPPSILDVPIPEDVVTENTTFAELASLMLPPWYNTSLMAVETYLVPERMERPGTVQIERTRKVLLMTRNLLDAFSPVFAKHSLWRDVRKQYKYGYEIVGYFQDLEHSGADYSPALLEKRRQDVLDWKDGFLEFVDAYNVLEFVTEEEDPSQCTRQKSSHLFWADLRLLPCGSDPATASLRHLGRVQLTNAANYWNTVQYYDTVVPQEREIEFHNLRKELRIFLDEHGLFGDILLPIADDDGDTRAWLDTLDTAQTMLGHINDEWTAYDIYFTHDTHHKQQAELAIEIDDLWADFCDWALVNDLAGVMQSVLNVLEQENYVV